MLYFRCDSFVLESTNSLVRTVFGSLTHWTLRICFQGEVRNCDKKNQQKHNEMRNFVFKTHIQYRPIFYNIDLHDWNKKFLTIIYFCCIFWIWLNLLLNTKIVEKNRVKNIFPSYTVSRKSLIEVEIENSKTLILFHKAFKFYFNFEKFVLWV